MDRARDDRSGPDGATPEADATRILRDVASGRRDEADRLLDIVYGELHRLAQGYLARERGDHTLQPTALVHEAYLRLIDQTGTRWADRAHFLAVGAQAMRRILVDHARARARFKRGGGWRRVELEAVLDGDGQDEPIDLVRLDAALERLHALSERQAKVVELRFFGGLDLAAVAEVLESSERTVSRDWRFARAWLSKELRG